MAWAVRPEYADKFIGDINSFASDDLKVFAEQNPELMNKYFIKE